MVRSIIALRFRNFTANYEGEVHKEEVKNGLAEHCGSAA
jgi:hypothetical protein